MSTCRTVHGFDEFWGYPYYPDAMEDRFQPGYPPSLRACLKSRMRGHVIVGVMTISTDVNKLYDTDLSDAGWVADRADVAGSTARWPTT
jgi:hypothetical protein